MYDSYLQHYYLRARWYNPANGRFNRMDPFAGNNQDPQSLHKYLYAHCNPVNAIDPTGFEFRIDSTLITFVIMAILFNANLSNAPGPGEATSPDASGDLMIDVFICLGIVAGVAATGWAMAWLAEKYVVKRAVAATEVYVEKISRPFRSFWRWLRRARARVTRNALKDLEHQAAKKMASLRGGHFRGQLYEMPGIDGWLDDVAVSIKSIQHSSSPYRVLIKAADAADEAAAAGYRGIELVIDAPNVPKNVMLDFITNNPTGGLANIPQEGIFKSITIMCKDGRAIVLAKGPG